MNGTVYRLQSRRPGHWGPPADEPPVEVPPAATPDYWLGTLAMTVGAHLDGRIGTAELRREYERFLSSPVVAHDDELRAILPPSKRRTHT